MNNAGLVFGKEEVGAISESDIDTMFQTNVLGLITITQLFVNGTLTPLAQVFGSYANFGRPLAEFKKQHSGQSVASLRTFLLGA